MSGLTKEEGGRTFLGIFDGNFEVRYKTPQEGCKNRVNKNNKTIYFQDFNALTGTLRGLTMKEAELVAGIKTMFYVITMQDSEGKMYQLDLQESSSSTFYLLGKLAQVDVTKPFKIKVWATVDNDKKKTNFAVYQGSSDSVKALWTKDNPNGCPEMVKVKFKGNDVWDDTERNAFVREFMHTNVASKIEAPVEATTSAPDGPQDDTEEPGADAPDWLKGGAGAQQQAPPPTAKDEKPTGKGAPTPKTNPFAKK